MHRQTVKEVLRKSSIADRLEGVPIEQRLEGVPVELRLAGLTDDDLRDLAPEAREALATLRRLLEKKIPPSS
ncbi:MAG: hypothetical protein ACRDD1_15845 [Planctomycetia bacterium]